MPYSPVPEGLVPFRDIHIYIYIYFCLHTSFSPLSNLQWLQEYQAKRSGCKFSFISLFFTSAFFLSICNIHPLLLPVNLIPDIALTHRTRAQGARSGFTRRACACASRVSQACGWAAERLWFPVRLPLVNLRETAEAVALGGCQLSLDPPLGLNP